MKVLLMRFCASMRTSDLRNESGVYAILGRRTIHHLWTPVDIGESEDVKKRVENHDRKNCWKSATAFCH